jgi:hypothetical protein
MAGWQATIFKSALRRPFLFKGAFAKLSKENHDFFEGFGMRLPSACINCCRVNSSAELGSEGGSEQGGYF